MMKWVVLNLMVVLISCVVELMILVCVMMFFGDLGWMSIFVFGYLVCSRLSLMFLNLLWMRYEFCYSSMFVLVFFWMQLLRWWFGVQMIFLLCVCRLVMILRLIDDVIIQFVCVFMVVLVFVQMMMVWLGCVLQNVENLLIGQLRLSEQVVLRLGIRICLFGFRIFVVLFMKCMLVMISVCVL